MILGGKLDYLVLNHVVPNPLGWWEGSTENFTQFNKVFEINLKAYVHLATHSYPYLEEQAGHIIVMSSIAGE